MAAETMEFKAELKQLMDIIIHSLYTNKDVFLRELISNACDAIDKARFESITNTDLLEDDSDWKIRIVPDEENSTLTVSDNGIGMSHESIIEELGTIAKSGTQQFLEQLKEADAKDRPELIGQFGVGFYSSFMVADKVTVVSRQAGDKAAGVKWESDGQGEFTLEAVEKEKRGTDVILHFPKESEDYLHSFRIGGIVKKFSDFVEHPIICVTTEKEEDQEPEIKEEQLNSGKAIWLRPKSEVSDEEYEEFYKHISRDTEKPAKTVHYSAEGTLEFKSLLFIPEHKPFDLLWGPPKSALQLYVRRVFITDDCEELMPLYLRFVKGVVDSSDLDLNVSRETLQHNPVLNKIQNNLVNKVLSTLAEMKEKEEDEYEKFYKELGVVLKEGVSQDWGNREKVADLLLFESTKTEPGKFTTLAKYVEGMSEDQKEIYFIIGESRGMVESSPLLERFKARDYEVLLLTDPFDEFMVQSLTEYKEKPLKATDRGEIEETDDEKEKKKSAEEELKGLMEFLNDKIEEVKEVRLSSRLQESAACLVVDEGEMSAHMERLMSKIGRGEDVPEAKRILELNPEHPAVGAVQALYASDPKDPRVEDYGHLFYDQAVVAEGSKVRDPAAFARRINELLLKDAQPAGGEDGEPEEEEKAE